MQSRFTVAVLAFVAILAAAGVARAQMDVGGLKLEGYGEAGLRFLPEDPSRKQDAKFEEYRDINQGLYLEGLQLRLFRPDEKYSFELGGRDWGLQTQEFHLLGEQLGRWQVGFDWDQMRHLYSTTARTFETEVREGVWTLPAARPPLSLWNSASGGPRDVSVRWDTAHAFVRFTPTPALDLLAEYTRIHKDGDRPVGMAFGSPGGIFLQILEPINQTIHDFRLRGTWARERWQLQFGYTMSIFVEDDRFLRADNPCTPNPAPAAPCPAVGTTAAFGTYSLPPSNQAHTLNLAGGVNLPMRTRVNGSFSYSLRFQNEDFLQQTYSNSLSLTTPSVRLPAKSLDGNVQVALANITVTSRPLPAPVTFTAKYRLYDYMDFSRQPSFEGYLLNDQSAVNAPGGPVPEPFRAVRESYTRQNGDLDARWKLLDSVALTIGPSWEQWRRSYIREVPESDEFFAKAALDVTPNDWLLVRATYLPSFRRINRYRTNAERQAQNDAPPAEGTGGSAFASIQSYLLRKFDESDRDRQRADLMIELTPFDRLAITPAVGYTWDRYLDPSFTQGNLLGLQNQTTWSAGMDVTWTPVDRLRFTTGYMHESNFQKMRSRNRYLTTGDDPAADWISDMADTVDTYSASLRATLIPEKLDLTLSGSYSYALGTVNTWNPNLRTANNISPSVNGNTLANPWPAYEDGLLRLESALTYHFTKRLSTRLYYIFEQFDYHNWQTDTLNPFLPGVAAVYLGNSPRGYTAQIVGATLRFKFE